MAETTCPPDVEIECLGTAYRALAQLDPDGKQRALDWLKDKLGREIIEAEHETLQLFKRAK